MTGALADALSPAALLRQLGLRPRKRWSQSFLRDPGALDAIVRAAALEPTDEVLEIGPGLGALTARLAPRVRRLVAVEIDPLLSEALPRLLRAQNLEILQIDALRLDPAEHFPGPYKLVANLPYHITSPTILRFLLEVKRPSLIVLTVQLEVAERIAADVGDMSYLSVAVQLLAGVEIVRRIPARAFYPPPSVDSAVLRLRTHPEPAVPVEDPRAFLQVVMAGFTQPRKRLDNSLAQGLKSAKAEATALLESASVDPSRRPQTLSLEEWGRVYQAVERRAR